MDELFAPGLKPWRAHATVMGRDGGSKSLFDAVKNEDEEEKGVSSHSENHSSRMT
jgi:hypothetical protein